MIWETSRNIFGKMFWIILLFSLFATITFEAIRYVTDYDLYPSDMKKITWGTDLLTRAIQTLQKGLGINVLIAIPEIIISVGLILVQILLNSILLINWLINKALVIILLLVALSEETAISISSILAWLIEAPLIIGVVVELGQIIYTLVPLKK